MKTITSDNNTLLINYFNDIKYNLTELTRSDCGQQQTIVCQRFCYICACVLFLMLWVVGFWLKGMTQKYLLEPTVHQTQGIMLSLTATADRKKVLSGHQF